MKILYLKKQHGFTLIELLVVMAIVGILASATLAMVQDVRANARDAARKQSLQQVKTALERYYNEHRTYQVSNSGYLGGGQGWLGYEDGAQYATAVTRVLFNLGYLKAELIDDPVQDPGFMIYTCNGGQDYAISATLEAPTPAEIAFIQTTCNGTGGNGTHTRYGKNYAIVNP